MNKMLDVMIDIMIVCKLTFIAMAIMTLVTMVTGEYTATVITSAELTVIFGMMTLGSKAICMTILEDIED